MDEISMQSPATPVLDQSRSDTPGSSRPTRDRLNDVLRFVFYAAVIVLLAVAASTLVDLTKAVMGAGSLFGSDYGDGWRGIIAMVGLGGPATMLIAALVAATRE